MRSLWFSLWFFLSPPKPKADGEAESPRSNPRSSPRKSANPELADELRPQIRLLVTNAEEPCRNKQQFDTLVNKIVGYCVENCCSSLKMVWDKGLEHDLVLVASRGEQRSLRASLLIFAPEELPRKVVSWENVMDDDVYSYGSDPPLQLQVDEMEGQLRNIVRSNENSLAQHVTGMLSAGGEFTDIESLSAVRKVYEPRAKLAKASVRCMLNILNDSECYGQANHLIHDLLLIVQKSKSTQTVYEFDAVFRVIDKEGKHIAVLVEHKSTLDHSKVEAFSMKIDALIKRAANDRESMVGVFRGMRVLPIIYGNAPNDKELLAVQEAATQANILFLSPGVLPVVELDEGLSHQERHRDCGHYTQFVRAFRNGDPVP
jgi:hypothetical protein